MTTSKKMSVKNLPTRVGCDSMFAYLSDSGLETDYVDHLEHLSPLRTFDLKIKYESFKNKAQSTNI